MILVDTAGVLAAIDGDHARHDEARETLQSSGEPLVMSPYVLAELDYLLATRFGPATQQAFLSEVADGWFELVPFGTADVKVALQIMRKYRDQHVGLTDASIVVLADRFRCTDVLTLDERHFRVLRPLRGGRFRILPQDA
ncbi:MAG: PIN domain-containing protein [Gaiella sp.]